MRTDPMRVLYIARAPFISGAERALESTLRHLDRSIVTPSLVLGHESDLIDTARSLDIPVTVSDLPKRSRRNPLGWWRSVKRLDKIMKEFKPHVTHANDIPSCQAMSVVAGRLGIPRVVHIRWGIAAKDAGWWGCRGIEQIICISQWIQSELGDTTGTPLQSSRVGVVHDAVDWPRSGAHDDDATEEELAERSVGDNDNPTGSVTLGFAGQLIESKGLDLVIEAMGKLPVDQRPRLIVAGKDTQTDGEYQKQLETLARECGVDDRVSWVGFLDDVSWLYRQVHAVVCPSRLEPLGLVPLEAARYRKPALVNRTGGLAETVVDGETGFHAEPTVESWTRVLGRARDLDDLERFGVAAHERTQRLHAPEVYQAKLMKIYRDLIDHGDPLSPGDGSQPMPDVASMT